MKIKIKKLHPDAQIPAYAKAGDAGMDLTAITKTWDEFDNVVYGTGIAIEIPEGYVVLLFPRSSNAKKRTLLSNSVGIIDSGYVGELIFKFKVIDKLFSNSSTYAIGDRIGQLIVLPYPKVEFEEIYELSITDRGHGGFGSTDVT